MIVDTDEDIAGNTTVGAVDDELEVVYPRVLAASGARSETGSYRGPGVWYLSLYLISNERKPAKVEFPVDFELEAAGDPQPDACPSRRPRRRLRRRRRRATPAAAAPRRARSSGSGWWACWWAWPAAGSPRRG